MISGCFNILLNTLDPFDPFKQTDLKLSHVSEVQIPTALLPAWFLAAGLHNELVKVLELTSYPELPPGGHRVPRGGGAGLGPVVPTEINCHSSI